MGNRIETWEEQVKQARAAQAAQAEAGDAPVQPQRREPVIPPPAAATQDVHAKTIHDSAFRDTSAFGKWATEWDFVLVFLTAWLWIVFVLANAYMGLILIMLLNGGGDGDRAVVVLGATASVLALSGGFLAVIHVIRRGTQVIAAAIVASPDATAAALRKAAKSKD